MRINYFIFVFLFFSQIILAQELRWHASIEKVDTSGFYNIYLNPDVTSKLRYELPDIRLYDSENNEVPYILRLDRKHNYSTKLRKLAIIKNKYHVRKGMREILLENKRKEEISNFILTLEKTQAIVSVKILGSSDKKNWYILKNSSLFHIDEKNDKQVEILIQDIPLTNFSFFKLELTGNSKEKLALKSVFYRKHISTEKNYMQLISPSFTQNDTLIRGKSIVTIKFKQPEFIDKLRFSFKDSDYFLRKASLLKVDSVGEKKFNLQQYDRKKYKFVITSSTPNEFFFTNFKAQQLKIEIDNQDDKPLKMIAVRAFQQNAYLIAHLEAGKSYRLQFGSSRVAAPLYDLNYFTDSIPLILKKVEVGKVFPNPDDKTFSKRFEVPIYLLWTLAIGLAIFLSFMVFKMFKIIQ